MSSKTNMNMKMNIKWNICRICLNGEDQDLQMCSIFSEDQNKIEIYTKISECGGIQIEKDVNLPDLICKKCLVYLNVSYKFRTICQESDDKLQQFLVKSNIPMEKDLKFEVDSDGDDNGNDANVFDIEENTQKNEEELFQFVSEPAQIKMSDKNENEQNEVLDESNIISDMPIEISIGHQQEQHMDVNYTTQSIGRYLDDGSLVLEEVKVIEVSENKDEQKLFTTEVEYDDPNDVDYVFDPIEESEDDLPQPKANETTNILPMEQVITIYPDDFKKTKQNKFICDICGNTYPRKYSLQNHYKFHLGEKNFKCDFCNKAFVTDNQLIRHIRTHTGERPYACKYCDRRFSDISTKIKHERIHTNERPYKCDECGKAFNYSNVLRHHQMVHTGEKPYECVDCNRKFTKKHQYKAHLQTFAHQQMARKL